MQDVVTSLIRQSHGDVNAEAYRVFSPTPEDIEGLMKVGLDVLKHFPFVPGACAMMGAMYAARLQMDLEHAPTYLVAGALLIQGTPVFGEATASDEWRRAFTDSAASWNGHCWIVCGSFIADVSIFRTAYSPKSPPPLAGFVENTFGKGRGLFVCKADELPDGLEYVPQYVVPEDQITALMRGARVFFES